MVGGDVESSRALKGAVMWMLLGLAGLLVASSLADIFIPSEAASNADAPDSDGLAADDVGTEQAGDLLAEAYLVAPEVADDGLADEAENETDEAISDAGLGAMLPDGAPDLRADDSDNPDPEPPVLYSSSGHVNSSSGEDWLNSEFISSDIPPQDPAAYYIETGDDGDQVAGGAGNDRLTGGEGDDWLDGQGGDDHLSGGGGNDTLIGGTGKDTLSGGAGNDSLISGSGDGLLIGGAGDDVLIGGADNDALFGGTGDDTLQGGFGNDVLVAGEGNDLLNGGDGNDTLFGYTPDDTGRDIDGADYLNGGRGDDVLVLGSGDVATGGEGADTFILGTWIDPEEPAIITDFDPEHDTLSFAFNAHGEAPVLTTEYDAEAGELRVMLDGELVARMQGVESLEADAMTMMPVQQP